MITLSKGDWLERHKEDLSQRIREERVFDGTVTFIPEWDELVPGLRRGTFSLVAGPSRVGKSSWVTRVVLNNWKYGGFSDKQAVLYVLAEMGADLLVNRFLSQLTGIPGKHFNIGDFRAAAESGDLWKYENATPKRHWAPTRAQRVGLGFDEAVDEIRAAYRALGRWNISILDDPAPTTLDIRRRLEELHRVGYDVPLVVVDHMGEISDQLLVEGHEGHDVKLQYIKTLAGRFNTHMMVIHHLTKAGGRKEGKPSWNEMKGSSGAQFKSDYAFMMWSEDLIELDNGEVTAQPERITVKIACDKDRVSGGTGRVGAFAFYSRAGHFVTDKDWDPDMRARYRKYTPQYFEPIKLEDEDGEEGTYK